MEKFSENPLLFYRNLQTNKAQFFWDTLYSGSADNGQDPKNVGDTGA